MSVIYLNLDANFDSCATIIDRIDKINAIISSLFDTALRSVGKGDRVEYSIDTGATKQRVVYRSVTDITKAIQEYEDIKARYMYQLNGGMYQNVDEKNLRHRRRRNGF